MIILLILITLITYHVWFFSYNVLTHGDWWYHSYSFLKGFFVFPSIWDSTSLGEINVGLSFYPFQLLFGILAQFGAAFPIGERLVFMFPSVIICPIASYFFLRYITKSSKAAFIGSIVYSFNNYFLLLNTALLTIAIGYALTPLVLLLYIVMLEKKQWIYAVLCGLLCFILSFYEFRIFYIISAVFMFYLLFRLIILRDNKVLLTIILGIAPLIITFLLNSYWILAFTKTGTIASNTFFSRGLFGNNLLYLRYAVNLFHPFWTNGAIAIFNPQPIPFFQWLIPLAAFTGAFLNRRKPFVIFFTALTIIGIILTKQVDEPFTFLYEWLYYHVPGFNVFREASKFFILIALGYSVLIAFLIDWLLKISSTKKEVIIFKYLFITAIAAVVLWNTKPLITTDIGTLFISRYPDKDYAVLNTFIDNQKSFFRTLSIPTLSRWTAYNTTHPRVSAVSTLQGSWDSFVTYNYKDSSFPVGGQITEILKKPFSDELLDQTSVKYIIVPIVDKENDDNFYVYYGDRNFFISELNKIPYLKRRDIKTKTLAVYENMDFRPHVYITEEKETLTKKVPYKTVQFNTVSANQYDVTLNNVSKSLRLNFSEAYHPDWKVYVGNATVMNTLMKKEYFINTDHHLETEAKLNSFIIDPSYIKSNISKDAYSINKDGSINLKLSIYFLPQSYVYLGLSITIMVLTALIGSIIYYFITHGKEKKRK